MAETLRVRALVDPVFDRAGWWLNTPKGDEYLLTYWLPVLGPSTTLLARSLAGTVTQFDPDRVVELVEDDLARSLGLRAQSAPWRRTVDRLARFGVAQWQGDVLAVRRAIHPVPLRYQSRWPEWLQRRHRVAVSRVQVVA